ncbi:hypothetical protein ACLK17_21945 [Escherichia coli]
MHTAPVRLAAPRRLALKVANLAEAQPDREIEKRGPGDRPGVRR